MIEKLLCICKRGKIENKLVVRLILRIPMSMPGKYGPHEAQIIHNDVHH